MKLNLSDLYNWKTSSLEKVRFIAELFQYDKVKYLTFNQNVPDARVTINIGHAGNLQNAF